jgi:hypothetical protein
MKVGSAWSVVGAASTKGKREKWTVLHHRRGSIPGRGCRDMTVATTAGTEGLEYDGVSFFRLVGNDKSIMNGSGVIGHSSETMVCPLSCVSASSIRLLLLYCDGPITPTTDRGGGGRDTVSVSLA